MLKLETMFRTGLKLWNVVLFCIILLPVSAYAHFLLNLNVRIIHVEHLDEGLRVYQRMPMPYLVADKVGQVQGDVLPKAAPFTTNAMEEGQLVHFVDLERFSQDPMGLAALAQKGLDLRINGERLAGRVDAIKLHPVGTEPGFATLSEARIATQTDTKLSPPLYVGDVLVDVVLVYEVTGPVKAYSLASTLDPGLPEQEMTANLILDYFDDTPQVFRSRGLMTDPISIGQADYAGFMTFVWEGVRHILEGLDHVLFVICLVVGAQTLRTLLGRVTGFTIGHSVTLSLGFFGFVPSGAWFIPAVESGIALSIIFAAWTALRSNTKPGQSETAILAVTTAIGLLHGLGFSFVLQKILQVSSPNIWQSLLAFNVGVEVGQVLIILFVWPLLLLLRHHSLPAWSRARITLASICALIACYWSVTRLGEVYATLV